jgi:hypothetical protein
LSGARRGRGYALVLGGAGLPIVAHRVESSRGPYDANRTGIHERDRRKRPMREVALDESPIRVDFEGAGAAAARRRGGDRVMAPTFQRLSRDAIEQHRQIHFYLDQVEHTLKGLVSDLTTPEPMRRLAAQLQGLKERLLEHHQTEEREGLFQAILEVLPSRRVEVDRLLHQHGRMIEILEMARIHAHHGEPSEAEGLRIDLEGFLRTFRQHERDEEELFRMAAEREHRVLD